MSAKPKEPRPRGPPWAVVDKRDREYHQQRQRLVEAKVKARQCFGENLMHPGIHRAERALMVLRLTAPPSVRQEAAAAPAASSEVPA